MGEKPADLAARAASALPGDAESVVSEIMRNISSNVGFKKEESDKLAAQIRSVLVDRMGSFDDMRMGRILGHAIATI